MEINLKIANVTLSYDFPFIRNKWKEELPKIYESFLSYHNNPSILIEVNRVENIRLDETVSDKLNFLNGDLWTHQKIGNVGYTVIRNPENELVAKAKYKSNLEKIEVTLTEEIMLGFDNLPKLFLLPYPFDEIILLNLLTKYNGFLMHGCGIDMSKEGYLFLGDSDKGKSTFANLVKDKYNNIKILNDDRIIVKKLDNEFYLFGQPWYSSSGFVNYGGVHLKKVFFLEHGKYNRTYDLGKKEKMRKLFVSFVPPYFDRKGMGFAVSELLKIAEDIPCADLEFVKIKKNFNLEKILGK